MAIGYRLWVKKKPLGSTFPFTIEFLSPFFGPIVIQMVFGQPPKIYSALTHDQVLPATALSFVDAVNLSGVELVRRAAQVKRF